MTRFSEDSSARGRVLRAALLIAGVVATQALLYGPSLVGSRIFLPLDLLASGDVYLPDTFEYAGVVPHDPALFDLVLHYELARRFATAEVRAGRLPLWDPHAYAGAPFARWEKYSPFSLLSYLFPSPVTLAWVQLAKALVAAGGAYVFFRRVSVVGFWPAAIGAWAYPLTAFFVLWAGFPVSFVTAWLPWILLATDAALRRPRSRAGPALAALSALAIFAGHADVAALVLLTSGLYAIWCLFDAWLRPLRTLLPLRLAQASRALCVVAAAWLLGIGLSAIYWLPMVDYLQTGARFENRAAGEEERPPEGLRALPEIVLPDMYGSMQSSSRRLAPGNRLENASATFTGVLATLFLAPLAWCSRRHRSLNVFWGILACVSLGWTLGLPGLVPLLRLPGLNLLSYNRFVFAASFAILACAVVGLDLLGRRMPEKRSWFALPILLLTGLVYFCVRFALEPPVGPLAPAVVRASFAQSFAAGAVAAGVALAAWLVVWTRSRAPVGFTAMLGVALLGELLWFGHGVNPQNDPALYYPRLPALASLAGRTPHGRALGAFVLPANLLEVHGLSDVRGYDGIDPARLVELLAPSLDPRAAPFIYPYAKLQFYTPQITAAPSGDAQLPPVLDMLGVRYLIFRGAPPRGRRAIVQAGGYWVAENRDALPRVFLPRRIERLAGDAEVLARLGNDAFDPREVAYVIDPVAASAGASGSAEIVAETPTRVTVATDLDGPGLVVLADRFDAGWRATLDGRPAPILRTNHVLRGVEAPRGRSSLVFRYAPPAFAWGWKLSAAAAALWIAWFAVASRRIPDA